MDIYFVDISENYELERQKISKLQHRVGREVLSYLLKNKYNVESDVLEDNGKPYIEDNPIYFSISHSGKLVGIAFDKNKIGLDIEIKKKRNYKSILKHFKIEKDVTEDEFFQMWTVYEAEYKSGVKNGLKSFKYDDYFITVSFKNESELDIYNIEYFTKNIVKLDNPILLKNLSIKL